MKERPRLLPPPLNSVTQLLGIVFCGLRNVKQMCVCVCVWGAVSVQMDLLPSPEPPPHNL